MAADGAHVPGEGQDVLPETMLVEERYERVEILAENTRCECR